MAFIFRDVNIDFIWNYYEFVNSWFFELYANNKITFIWHNNKDAQRNLCVVLIKRPETLIRFTVTIPFSEELEHECNCTALPLKLKRLANIWFILFQNLIQLHRINQKILWGNGVPFSRFSSGIVLRIYDNCSCGLFRSMLRPPISRLCD